MRLDPIILTTTSSKSSYAPLGTQSKADSNSIELVGLRSSISARQQVKPDDHSEVVPLLPIPNRTVKRLSADDSADSRVKVGHCQANIMKAPGESRAFSSLKSVIVEIILFSEKLMAL